MSKQIADTLETVLKFDCSVKKNVFAILSEEIGSRQSRVNECIRHVFYKYKGYVFELVLSVVWLEYMDLPTMPRDSDVTWHVTLNKIWVIIPEDGKVIYDRERDTVSTTDKSAQIVHIYDRHYQLIRTGTWWKHLEGLTPALDRELRAKYAELTRVPL